MDSIKASVQTKYSYLTSEEVNELVENALGWFYSLRYPCELDIRVETRPITSFMDKWAIKTICDEIAQRNGFNTALAYRENGIQFTFDSAWISESVKKAIVPIVGVV
jgi:hypothetical protein